MQSRPTLTVVYVDGVISCEWRGQFSNAEVNALHSEAFGTRLYTDQEWNWEALVARRSLGWVVARDGTRLVGLVNVLWDGLVHAWLQDTMVAVQHGRQGVGTQLVEVAREAVRSAGCEYLHVDFEPHLASFYVDACGFESAPAGVMRL